MQKQEQGKKIKVLLCQINPFYKDKLKTSQRLEISLQKYTPKDNLDLVILPELAFTGYNFQNTSDAITMAVSNRQGLEFDTAKKIALALKSYVIFGYIEKEQPQNSETKLYNAAAVINREGITVAHYRKCHLYYNDKLWASPGSKFCSFTIKNTQDVSFECTLALGSDLSPKDFTSGQFELGQHLVATKSELLLLPACWTDSDKDELHKNDVAATYSYWINRLTPVSQSGRNVLALIADRSGHEFDYFAKKQTMFYGSSAAVMLNPHKILCNLDSQKEGFLLIDTFLQ